MSWVHKDFQLNGRSFSNSEELISFCKGISSSLVEFSKDWFSPSEFVTVNTSGSTGNPKSIQLKKEYMRNSALATGEFFNLKPQTTALCCLPIDYIAGKMMLVRAMTLGWHIDVIAPSSNPLQDVEKQYDFSAMVPLQLKNSLDKINRIDQLIVGGGAVSSELQEQIQDVSTKIYATYGMTETITHIAVKSLNMSSRGSMTKRSHYKTLPNVSISVNDKNCLVINAPKVSDDEIVTNDVVTLISDNEFEWKGRFDNVINSGGIKLHPEQIERKLSSKISARFFVAGISDENLGEKLVLIVEGESEMFAPDFQEVLNKYEVPKEIFFVDSFVETPTGKIQRSQTLQKALPR